MRDRGGRGSGQVGRAVTARACAGGGHDAGAGDAVERGGTRPPGPGCRRRWPGPTRCSTRPGRRRWIERAATSTIRAQATSRKAPRLAAWPGTRTPGVSVDTCRSAIIGSSTRPACDALSPGRYSATGRSRPGGVRIAGGGVRVHDAAGDTVPRVPADRPGRERARRRGAGCPPRYCSRSRSPTWARSWPTCCTSAGDREPGSSRRPVPRAALPAGRASGGGRHPGVRVETDPGLAAVVRRRAARAGRCLPAPGAPGSGTPRWPIRLTRRAASGAARPACGPWPGPTSPARTR